MNLKEIRDDVRSLIIEPTPGFRSNAEINRWINQGHQLLGMLYRVEAFKKITITTGVTFNKLPSDLLVLKGAWTEGGQTLPIVPIASGNELNTSDVDEMTIFRFGNNFVVVAPTPEIPLNSTITLFYDRRPKRLATDTDEPDIAEPFHRYIVSFATMRALQKDEDYEGAAVYAQEFQEGMQMIIGHKTPISQDADTVFELVRLGILNPAEAAEWLNLPMKKKVWKRVEVEEKGMALFHSGVIDKADLIKNTEFTDREEIQKRLTHTASEFISLPSWEGPRHGE